MKFTYSPPLGRKNLDSHSRRFRVDVWMVSTLGVRRLETSAFALKHFCTTTTHSTGSFASNHTTTYSHSVLAESKVTISRQNSACPASFVQRTSPRPHAGDPCFRWVPGLPYFVLFRSPICVFSADCGVPPSITSWATPHSTQIRSRSNFPELPKP